MLHLGRLFQLKLFFALLFFDRSISSAKHAAASCGPKALYRLILSAKA
jgi:hypothetical protein